MKVGTICKLKVDCLGNKAGTLGVVFNDYGDGFQAIFENGNYDGFSTADMDYFVLEVGFEESLAAYRFRNVMQVATNYTCGLFDVAWSDKWKSNTEKRK